jgi:hypothetical protein
MANLRRPLNHGGDAMKATFRISCALTLQLLLPTVAMSDNAWLLLDAGEHSAVVMMEGAQTVGSITLGDQVSFGESTDSFVFLALDKSKPGFVMHRVSKSDRASIVTQPIVGHPVADLSGPIRSVIVEDDVVYYVRLRLIDGSRTEIERNEKGGAFDLCRLLILTGETEVWPLPKEIANVRLAQYGKDVLIYSWNGYRVWRWDSLNRKLDPLVQQEDVADILTEEDNATIRLGAFADFAVLPGFGVYRLSRTGHVHQVLDTQLRNPDTTPVNSPRRHLDVTGGAESRLVAKSQTSNDSLIGVISKNPSHWLFSLIDVTTFEVIERTELPLSIIPSSLFLDDRILYYFDQDTNSLNRASNSNVVTLWRNPGTWHENNVRVLRVLRSE